MKIQHILPFLFSLLAVSAFSQSNIQQPTSINADGAAPTASAMLDVSATDKGMLVPRMTSAQRTVIASPATGLLVFDTTTGGFWFYNGTTWTDLSAPKILQDADGDTKIQVEESPDEDIIRFDIGGTESMVLRKNAFGSTRLELPDNALYASTFVGQEAGLNNMPGGKSGEYNSFFGYRSGKANTTGYSNTASGAFTLSSNTSGLYNTASGASALYSNTDGSHNTASGASALYSNTSGDENTASGRQALYSNTSGDDNTASGRQALYSNTSGNDNTASGRSALYSNTDGSQNTASGASALYSNTIGSFNMACGRSALYSNTTGSGNTANGVFALFSNKANSRSTAIGYSAMQFADDRTMGRETYNTAVGYEALKGSGIAANNTGQYNTAVGDQALFSNTSGSYNTANGGAALYSNTTGSDNIANGGTALFSNTDGNYNTAFGRTALYSNTTGDYNTAIGTSTDVTSGNLSKATAIGYNAEVGCSNCMALGGTGANAVNVGIGTSLPEVKLHIVGGTDVGLGGGGFFVTGSTSGLNIGMDNNEIMARNNGAAATLTLNKNGGNVVIDDTNTGSKVGIGRIPTTRRLEVEGEASKATTGDWYANSDARLKKNIQPLNTQLMLQKLLALQGITYEWNDDKTDWKRPEGIQYGFTAQNIREVFPTLVQEDNLGYLQTAYGTYDAMTVEAIRALHSLSRELGEENEALKAKVEMLTSQLDKITAALQGAGITVEK